MITMDSMPTNTESCEVAFKILKKLMASWFKDVVANKNQFAGIVFSHRQQQPPPPPPTTTTTKTTNNMNSSFTCTQICSCNTSIAG
jgi:hypothetical protein